MARVLVCGGRNYSDAARLDKILRFIDRHYTVSTIISGGASGADSLAEKWADGVCVPKEIFKADWKAHGKAAGPIRNQRMLDEGKPDMVVAFPGGRGTADMLQRARKAGVKVHLIKGTDEAAGG